MPFKLLSKYYDGGQNNMINNSRLFLKMSYSALKSIKYINVGEAYIKNSNKNLRLFPKKVTWKPCHLENIKFYFNISTFGNPQMKTGKSENTFLF